IIYAILLGLALFLLISYLTPYRWTRIKTFFNPTENVRTTSYQLNQALIAIGSGGLTGVGYGKSTTKIHYLPQPIDDSIFAVIAEELGFAGALVFIALLLFLTGRAIGIARGAKDYEGKIVASGIVGLLGIQAFLNLAAIVALVPLTGIPLPFISYGGSSLLVTMITIGILINIRRQS
ncbi:FtsW/RodA/SpoVE family cell cycle protein, partial [Candidatus Curtissbacteria bacterium]|nr:FtsW/RodA/SpoVE family cell cycle protein [Candidatus Curtissbacteria bacterium]